MLHTLSIRDYAIIEHSELHLQHGMTALTGETGAGKSMLIDALGLVLGQRADPQSVREGATRAEISATFELEQRPEAQTWLEAHELTDPDHPTSCIVRRVIRRDGRSRASINGSPCPVQQLRAVGELLVSIHGQHEHQRLNQREVQRQLLDQFSDCQAELTQTQQAAESLKALQQRLQKLSDNEQQREARLDLLRFQTQELNELDLSHDTLQQLEQLHEQHKNADKLQAHAQAALSALKQDDGPCAQALVQSALSALGQIPGDHPRLSSVHELLDTAAVHIDEAYDALDQHLASNDIDPARLQAAEEQLDTLHRLSRKHRVALEELSGLSERLNHELDQLENEHQDSSTLEAQIRAQTEHYHQAAQALSQKRQHGAIGLSQRITEAMQTLSLGGAQFKVNVNHDPTQVALHGTDTVELQVAANAGQPLRPLNQVASGGELARISLAIQVCTASDKGHGTLLFDEVDTGIGGGVAETVGQFMRRLGEKNQVLCVTHLAQVAAQAHQHIRVTKTQTDDQTHTQLDALDHAARTDELARMIGGNTITDTVRSHAREMLGG